MTSLGREEDGSRPVVDRGEWLIAAVVLLSPALGLGTRFPWSLLPWNLGRVLWTVATLALVGLLVSERLRLRIARWLEPWLQGRAWLVGLVAANLAFLLLDYVYFRSLGYTIPWLGIAACIVALPLVPRYPLLGSLGLSIALLIASLLSFPLVTARSDMLPAVQLALDQWAAGGDPYGRLTVSSGTDRMPYLPALLFAHLPAWAAGLDLRWNSVLYRVGWGLLLVHGVRRAPAASPLRACVILLLLNPYLTFRHELYFEFYLLLIAGLWIVPAASRALLALGLFTRQWTWILAPFLWLAMSRRTVRSRAATLARLAGWTAAWGGLFWLLLHRSTSPENLRIVLTKFQALVGGPRYLGDYGLTLQPLLMALGIAAATQWMQGTIVAALWLFSLRAAPARAAWLGLAALTVFILLNPLYWNYFAIELGLWLLGWDLWRRSCSAQLA